MLAQEFLEDLLGRGVELDPCATQAHWQNGITEGVIQTIFDAADTLEADHEFDKEEAVHRSTSANNHVERVEGYAPSQWAFGRLPTWSGRLFDDEADELSAAQKTDENYRKGLERQATAQHVMMLKTLRAQELRAASTKTEHDKSLLL